MKRIVTIDVGGTHVPLALAEIEAGRVGNLGEATTFLTGDFPSLERAWSAFAGKLGQALPNAVAIAFAGPVHGDVLKLTNSSWIIRPAAAGASLGVDSATVVNDFAAIGYAIAVMGPGELQHVCGPDVDLPGRGTISIVGPGTGPGVAHVLRTATGPYVSETEGGHMDFAPLDPIEDRLATALRARFRRVSAERILSGPGLKNIYEVMAEGDVTHGSYDIEDLWTVALAARTRWQKPHWSASASASVGSEGIWHLRKMNRASLSRAGSACVLRTGSPTRAFR